MGGWLLIGLVGWFGCLFGWFGLSVNLRSGCGLMVFAFGCCVVCFGCRLMVDWFGLSVNLRSVCGLMVFAFGCCDWFAASSSKRVRVNALHAKRKFLEG